MICPMFASTMAVPTILVLRFAEPSATYAPSIITVCGDYAPAQAICTVCLAVANLALIAGEWGGMG